MKRMTGGAVALFGVLMMLGIAGALENGAIGIGSAMVRLVLGCVAFSIGAAMFGGLE